MFKFDGTHISIVVIPGRNLFGKTAGLLGTFDKNATNDFKLPTGSVLPMNSNTSAIYSNFGNACKFF